MTVVIVILWLFCRQWLPIASMSHFLPLFAIKGDFDAILRDEYEFSLVRFRGASGT